MSDAGGDTREKVTPEVEEAILAEGKQAPDAHTPVSTSGSEPTENMEPLDEEAHLPYMTDPTPGAVTTLTPKTTKAQAKNEHLEPLPVGSWVELAATDAVEEAGGEVGTRAYVIESPKRLCNDPDCEYSPRDHYHQDPRVPILVRTRDEKSQEFSLTRDDFRRTETSGRHAVLPHG